MKTNSYSFSLLSIFIASRFGIVNACLLLVDRCVSHCPRNMHPYHTRCEGEAISQRTCYEPVQYDIGFTCGWSRCDCNGDLLLDEYTVSCIDFATCKANMEQRKKFRVRKSRKPRLGRLSKKLRLNQDEDFVENLQ